MHYRRRKDSKDIMEQFTAIPAGENILRIVMPYNVYTYLILGTEKAALIDTGYGVGSLKSYVRTLTKLPVTVLCTHGHVDHIGGSGEFEEVFLNRRDWELAARHVQTEKRQKFIAELTGQKPQGDFVLPRTAPFSPLEDGQTFSLGGVTLEMIACPGHTQGCLCVLLREQRLLILGDACNSKSFLFFPECSHIDAYLASLQRLMARRPEFDHVLFFHPDNRGDEHDLADNIEVCREILAGTDDRVPRRLLNTDLFIAKAIGPDERRLDGKWANIYYSADKC